jgi:hypothetical protein
MSVCGRCACLALCLPLSLSKQPLSNVSANALWVTKSYLKDDLRMFPLPQSDRPDVASQKPLGEESGHHWTPGIEVAARVTVLAPDNRRTLGVARYRGTLDQEGRWAQAAVVSWHWPLCAAVNVVWPSVKWGPVVSGAWRSYVRGTLVNSCVDKFKRTLARIDERAYGFFAIRQPLSDFHWFMWVALC